MTKPNKRPKWFPKTPYNHMLINDREFEKASIFDTALNAVLKAADEHGILFVKKGDYILIKKQTPEDEELREYVENYYKDNPTQGDDEAKDVMSDCINKFDELF